MNTDTMHLTELRASRWKRNPSHPFHASQAGLLSENMGHCKRRAVNSLLALPPPPLECTVGNSLITFYYHGCYVSNVPQY